MTERRRAEEALRLEETRLKSLLDINQKAAELSEREVIQLTLDRAVQLTQSQIGYLHFVNPDQESIQLFAWSTETLKTCHATHDAHYPISRAGVWADCAARGSRSSTTTTRVSRAKPVIRSDTRISVRHASVPILDGDQVVLILGVGNKSAFLP